MSTFKLFVQFFFSLITAVLIISGGFYAWAWIGEFIAINFGEGPAITYFSISLLAVCAFLMAIMVESN